MIAHPNWFPNYKSLLASQMCDDSENKNVVWKGVTNQGLSTTNKNPVLVRVDNHQTIKDQNLCIK